MVLSFVGMPLVVKLSQAGVKLLFIMVGAVLIWVVINDAVAAILEEKVSITVILVFVCYISVLLYCLWHRF